MAAYPIYNNGGRTIITWSDDDNVLHDGELKLVHVVLFLSSPCVSSASTLFQPVGGQDASNASGGEPQIDLANMSSSRVPPAL